MFEGLLIWRIGVINEFVLFAMILGFLFFAKSTYREWK